MAKRWMSHEIERLKSLAGSMPTSQIANEMERANSAVIMKAYELKLSLKVKPTEGRSQTFDPGPAGIDLNT